MGQPPAVQNNGHEDAEGTPVQTVQPLLNARSLYKRYGSTDVLRSIDFSLRPGEIVAVLGENGAGKSTFAKIIAGAVRPDGGIVMLDGRELSLHSPRDALRRGIAIIPQELATVPQLSVAENLLLGRWPARFGVTSPSAVMQRARRESERFGLTVDLGRRMSALKLADQQVAEILKALVRDARVLLLDEPTAALTVHESRDLFAVMRRLASNGVGIIFISHRLDEVLEVSDRIDVLRNGELVASVTPQATTPARLVAAMLGRSEDELGVRETREATRVPAIAIHDLQRSGQPTLSNVSLDVGIGEIVGLFGIRGSGIELIADALTGRGRDMSGTVVVGGNTGKIFRSPRAARACGVAYLPADRKREGLIMRQTVQHNLAIQMFSALARVGVVRPWRERNFAQQQVVDFDIRTSNIRRRVRFLSGGNQQKVLLASRLAITPRVLVLHEPTRGVDVGARMQIRRIVRELADKGLAVLVVTSDVEEAVATDRVLVMRAGQISAELEGADRSQNQALAAAAASAS